MIEKVTMVLRLILEIIILLLLVGEFVFHGDAHKTKQK